MIDREARLVYAKLLRAFASGRITNREYEAGIPVSDDPLISRIDDYLVWPLYSDFHTHRLRGRDRLNRSGRKAFARCILFQNTSERYTWPERVNGPPNIMWQAATFAWVNRRYKRLKASFAEHGDEACWPFQQRVEMQSEADKPRLGLSPVYKPR